VSLTATNPADRKAEPTADKKPEPAALSETAPTPDPYISAEPELNTESDQVCEATTSSVAEWILVEWDGAQSLQPMRK